jgi:hypothetical protein
MGLLNSPGKLKASGQDIELQFFARLEIFEKFFSKP